MKKLFVFMALAAILQCAQAQRYTHIVYIPADGEHHFGFSVAPSFGRQTFGVGVEGAGTGTLSGQSDMWGSMTSDMGVGAGLFYGYETRHGRTLEWGNYTSLYYNVTPFGGTVAYGPGTEQTEHRLSYLAQRVVLHVNPFLAYVINDEWSVSAGVGLSVGPQLKSRVRVDGTPMAPDESSGMDFFNMVMGFLNLNVDANAGVKYWFGDDVFVGMRLQYTFFSLSSLALFDEEGDIDLEKFPNGVVALNPAKGTATARYFQPKNAFQAVVSVGYVW